MVGEHLTNAQWGKIGQYYINGMWLNHNYYGLTRHIDTDTGHENILLEVNRIQFDCNVTRHSQDYPHSARQSTGLEGRGTPADDAAWIGPLQCQA
jgi:hypothetical protein